MGHRELEASNICDGAHSWNTGMNCRKHYTIRGVETSRVERCSYNLSSLCDKISVILNIEFMSSRDL